VLPETKLTDARQDRVFFQEHLPGYALFHSCTQSNNSGHCRTGSGGVAIAVHKSLTSQNSVELIRHKGLSLASDHLQKREELYQVIQDAVSSENNKASHAGLPLPCNIMAGDMKAALFEQNVQRAKVDHKRC